MSYRILPLLVLSLAPAAFAATTDPAAPAAATKRDGVSIEDIRAFSAVFNAVKQAYVEEVDDKTLMEAAVRGLLADLDPHSEYLDTRAVEDLTEDTNGAYDGLGLEVLMMEGVMRVIAPIDDTPAQRAGVLAGDVISRVDGKPVPADGLTQAVDLLRGEPGTKVTLTIVREGVAAPLDLVVERQTIRVASVRARLLEPGYLYLRISAFQAETGAELRRKIKDIKSKSGAAVRGVVLDLRSNPGGLLISAVEVSDAFLEEGAIVSTKGRLKEAELSFSARPGDLVDGAPLVVLTDQGTASAAEIVAGALKDHRRALIMGSRTFGKGSVQTVLPLDNGHAIKLTTARYYTPNGTSIQASGINPDIALADLKLSVRDRLPSISATSERDLPGHLAGSVEVAPGEELELDDEALDDYALNEALNVLKGLALARERGSSKPKDG